MQNFNDLTISQSLDMTADEQGTLHSSIFLWLKQNNTSDICTILPNSLTRSISLTIQEKYTNTGYII